jgi:ESS family glutamate:Na+ symporter
MGYIVSLDTLETLMAASLVLLIGRQILARTPILRTYSIPEPVVGGLLVALLVFALRRVFQIDVRFDTTIQVPLMLRKICKSPGIEIRVRYSGMRRVR